MKIKQQIKELYQNLPPIYKAELISELLAEQELEGIVLAQAEQAVKQKRVNKPCPYCSSNKVLKRGRQNGSQVYQCKECKKNYRETTGTPLYRIQIKEKWQRYLDLMERGFPIKKIAEKLDISIQTSFDWRHKIISSLEQFTPKELSSTVECDEIEFSISNKGDRNLTRKARKRATDFIRNREDKEISTVQVITAIERETGDKFFKVVETKRLTKEQIEIALEGKLAKGTTLITDKHYSYKSYMKDHQDINHKRLLAKDHVDKKDKSIHLQNVNNVHSQVRDFIRPFKGVSSKYLQNYLNWYAYQNHINSHKETLKSWFVALLLYPGAYGTFLQFKKNAMLIRT